jgi:hypothetical protein
MNKWDDVSVEDLQQVIDDLYIRNCSHSAKVRSGLQEVLAEKLWGKCCDTCGHWDRGCQIARHLEMDCRKNGRCRWEKKDE